MCSISVLFFLVLFSLFSQNEALIPISAEEIGINVAEPSGATYCETTNSLFIICDKAACHFIYEYSLNGTFLNEWEYDKEDHDDVEAVACDDVNKLIFIGQEEEYKITAFSLPDLSNSTSYKKKKDSLFLIEMNHFTLDVTKIRHQYDKDADDKDPPGLEGLTVSTITGNLIVANEKKPTLILEVTQSGKILNSLSPDFVDDVSGLHFDSKLNILWVLSDKSSQVYATTYNGSSITVVDYWNLPFPDAEGIAIFNSGDENETEYMFITTDPSSPHGNQFLPVLYCFYKPEIGTGAFTGGNEYVEPVPNEPCSGCSQVWYDFGLISSFISSAEESSNQANYSLFSILTGLVPIFLVLLVVLLCTIFIVFVILRRRKLKKSLKPEEEPKEIELTIRNSDGFQPHMKFSSMWGFDPVHCIIDDFLFQGDCDIASQVAWFEEENIKAVVNVTEYIECYFKDKGVEYLHIKVDDISFDSKTLESHLEPAVEFIAKHKAANNKILVHCEAGISRSSTVTLAYLIKHENVSLQEAFSLLKSKRSHAQPNDGFWEVLCRWEKRHRGGQ